MLLLLRGVQATKLVMEYGSATVMLDSDAWYALFATISLPQRWLLQRDQSWELGGVTYQLYDGR